MSVLLPEPPTEPPRSPRKRRAHPSHQGGDALHQMQDELDDEFDQLWQAYTGLSGQVGTLAGEVKGSNAMLSRLLDGVEEAGRARERGMKLMVTTMGAVILVAFAVVAGLAGVGMQVKALGQEVMVSGKHDAAPGRERDDALPVPAGVQAVEAPVKQD